MGADLRGDDDNPRFGGKRTEYLSEQTIDKLPAHADMFFVYLPGPEVRCKGGEALFHNKLEADKAAQFFAHYTGMSNSSMKESIRVRTYRSAEELILELLNKTPGA